MADTTRPADSTHHMTKSPTTAVLLSMALPGLGQFYNEQYWKAPIFLTAAGASVFFIVDNQRQFADASDVYDDAVANNDPNQDFYLRQREFYRDNRDLAIAALLVTYLIAGVDAYVGAHLYDYTVDQPVAIYPAWGTYGPQITMAYRW
jgi:hypothetical protein